MVKLGAELNIPVVDDLGSGSFVDGVNWGCLRNQRFKRLLNRVFRWFLQRRQAAGRAAGGIVVGKEDLINKLKQNQLTRAIRVDRLTLAALVGTLRLYQRGELDKIPVWRMLTKRRLNCARMLNTT